jgi:CRP-like cAMP-binding protein
MCLRAGAGALLGLPGVVGSEPYTMTAVVHKGSDVRFVARQDFEELVQAEPALYLGLLKLLAAEVRAARMALCAT